MPPSPPAAVLPTPRPGGVPPLDSPRLVDLHLILALAAVYVIWSSTYLAMRVAVRGFPPMMMGAVRFVIAGAVLLAIARARGAAWPSARHWRHAAIVGILLFVGGNGLVGVAVQTIHSGVAAVAVATMPLWAAVAASIGGERPSAREWTGLALGFAGVVVLVGGATFGGHPAHWVALCVSPVAWAVGSILARRLPLPDGIAASAIQMIAGGVAMAAVGLARGERVPVAAPAEAWLAVGYLTVFGSLVAFSAYGWLLRHTRPAIATSYAYVNPALAVLLGAAVAGETIGVTTVLATVLIGGAVAIVVGRRR